MIFGRVATGALYLSYLPLIHAIASTVPRFSEETEIDDLVLIRSSEETEINSLVLISAYLFPNQSSFELAIKDPAWHQYDKADPSTYWSTGKQDVQNPNVTVATYAYTADNLERRGDDGYVAIDDGKKKHKYLGLLGLIPGAAIGAGLYHIGHKTYSLKHAKPTGVNIAAPWTPTTVNPPDILKPGKLGEIITNCGGALGPGDVPTPPAEPPAKVPGPPQEINVPKHPQASPPQGPKPIGPENAPKPDQSKPGEQPNTGDKSKPGKPIKPEELSKPADPPKPAEPPKPFDPKPVDPGNSKPPVDRDPFTYGRKPLDPNAPDIMENHVPTGPPERPPPEPSRGREPYKPFEPPPAKPVEPPNPPPQRRPGAKTPWEKMWEQKAAKDATKVQENLEKIEQEVVQQKKAEQAAERQRKLIEEQKETERLIEEQKRIAEEEAKRAQKARQEAEQLAEQERKATEQAKHAKEVEYEIEIEAEELERQRKQKAWDARKAEDQAWAREAKRLEDAKKAEAKEAAKNAKKQTDEAKKAGGEAKKATQHADRVAEEGKTTQQHLNEMLEAADDMEQRHLPKQDLPKQDLPKQDLPKDGPASKNGPPKTPPKAPEPEPPTKPKDPVGNGGPDPKKNPPAKRPPPYDPNEPVEPLRPKRPPPDPKKYPPANKPPPYDYNKPIEPLRPKRPQPDPNQKPPEFKDPWEGPSRRPPQEYPVSPNSHTPVQEPGAPPKPNEPLSSPKVNDDVLPKPGDPKGQLPKTHPDPKHHPQFPHQEGKPKHWDIEFADCLKRGIDAAACNDKATKYFEQAVDGRENHIVQSAPEHGQGYRAQDVPDGPKPAGQQGLRPTNNKMDLAKDSTYSDIPTDLTEEQAEKLQKELIEKEMGEATTDAFGKADNAAQASTAKKVERIGSELDGAADGALDDAAEQAGKKVKKMWKTFKGRAKNIKSGALRAWDAVTQLYAEIFKPFHWIWDNVLSWFKKLWGWMTGAVAGTSTWAKIGRCFGTFIKGFTESRAWKAVARSGLFKFCKRWGPKIMAKTSVFAGKLVSVVGWVTLAMDIKDVTETSACIGLAFEHKGDPNKMPSFCEGDATKTIVKWSLQTAGEGAAAQALDNPDEYVEQDNVVTTDSAWSIEEEKDPEAARKNWQDGVTIYNRSRGRKRRGVEVKSAWGSLA
ncbi:hypothetical protein MBLNU13_g08369t1 [Cladosporium sp. NU13]